MVFSFEFKDESETIKLALKGEVTHQTLRAARKELLALANQGKDIKVDLGKVSFLSQEGLAFLVNFYKKAKDEGVKASFYGGKGQVSTVLERTGIGNFLSK